MNKVIQVKSIQKVLDVSKCKYDYSEVFQGSLFYITILYSNIQVIYISIITPAEITVEQVNDFCTANDFIITDSVIDESSVLDFLKNHSLDNTLAVASDIRNKLGNDWKIIVFYQPNERLCVLDFKGCEKFYDKLYVVSDDIQIVDFSNKLICVKLQDYFRMLRRNNVCLRMRVV